MKPSPGNAFLYYLRALNSDIATILQTMGGTTLPGAYDMAIRVENTLIQGGKIAPRPQMPLFPEMPNHQPTIAPIPIASSNQLLVLPSPPSTSTSEMSSLESMMQTLMQGLDKKLQEQNSEIKKSLQEQSSELKGQIQDQSVVVVKMGNELTNLKKQQAQNRPPPNLKIIILHHLGHPIRPLILLIITIDLVVVLHLQILTLIQTGQLHLRTIWLKIRAIVLLVIMNSAYARE